MEIRDPIHGAIELTPDETAVVDNPFFQRLRHIKQMGFGEFSFPGATHNRYCHSLGAMHLAGVAFDVIFRGFSFSSKSVLWRLRQTVQLGALLHDIGHGPLSHSSEEVMPPLKDLNVSVLKTNPTRQANHEDYTLKIVTDSLLSEDLKRHFSDLKPIHIACLIDKSLECPDDFFMDGGLNFRPLLSQIISSELDVDRMDYLVRDSYYCGTNYGQVELKWLISHLTYHIENEQVHLALDRRAVFTFDDFLISRLHMYLVVYFHHKAVIYDEMLVKYLRSPDCDFFLPSDLNEYLRCDDYLIYTHMAKSSNKWAQCITKQKPYRMVFQSHATHAARIVDQLEFAKSALTEAGIDFIHSSSTGRLSKYYGSSHAKSDRIYLVDRSNKWEKPTLIEEGTEIFSRYENARHIERIYVDHTNYQRSNGLIQKFAPKLV